MQSTTCAQCQGKSVTSLLLQGPDLIRNLTGILLRFHMKRIALVCVKQQMFHQFKVQTQFRLSTILIVGEGIHQPCT